VDRLKSLIYLTAAILWGCGLPNYPSLNPPGQPSVLASPGTPTFTINATTQNNELEFKGFELYYKFYATPDQIEQNLQNVLEYNLRTTYGYRPVCYQIDTFSATPPTNLHVNKPLIYVQPGDRGTVFSVTITFPGLGSPIQSPVAVLFNGAPYYSPKDASQPLSIRRNVGDTNSLSSTYGQPKLFIAADLADPSTYQSTDIDVQGIWGSVSGGVAYLAMYVMSYGVQDYTTDLYSTPVYLGYVQINIDQ
jgi:hypothetical protein